MCVCRGSDTHDLANEVVDDLAGLDEEHDLPGLLQLGAQLLNRVGADDLGAGRLVREEAVNLLGYCEGVTPERKRANASASVRP